LVIIIAASMFIVSCSGTTSLPFLDGDDSGNGISIVVMPTFSIAAGAYTTVQTVGISSLTAGATIYYTTNGTAATTNDTQYVSAINVDTSITIQAIAVKTGLDSSPVAIGIYNIGEFLGTESGLTITLTNYVGTNKVVSIPDTINGKSLVSIGDWAIVNHATLTSLTIPDSVTNIGESGLNSNHELTNIIVGNGVISIGMSAFEWNTALVSITLGTGLITIGDNALAGCPLSSIILPDAVTSIGADAFNTSSLISITLPAGVTNIGSAAFFFCGSLTNITVLATTPPTLGANAFDNNATIRKIYVPAASETTYEAAAIWSGYAADIDPIL